MSRPWRSSSISAISKSLFRRNGFDPDYAVALAYWIKEGVAVPHGYERYWAHWPRITSLPDIPDAEAVSLFAEYKVFMGRR
jgi:hypothetical protein